MRENIVYVKSHADNCGVVDCAVSFDWVGNIFAESLSNNAFSPAKW